MIGSGLPKRKEIRLSGYDYSSNGAYFITICTKERAPIFGNIVVGVATFGGPRITLSPYGQIAERYINSINKAYRGVIVPIYCIMPNHVHFIVMIDAEDAGATRLGGSPRAGDPYDTENC